MSGSVIPMLLLAPVLIAVIFGDLSRLTISNRLVLVGLGIFVLSVPFFAAAELPARLIAGTVVFAALFGLFAAGMIGGGDVKMLPVVVLFVPPEYWSAFSLTLAVFLLVGVAGVSVARSILAPRGPTGWLALDSPKAFPMGVSIGLAGLAFPAVTMVV